MYNIYYNRPCFFWAKNRPLQTAKPHEKDWHWKVGPLPLRTGSTNQSHVLSTKEKEKAPGQQKQQTPWNIHRLTPDGAVHRPEGTTNNNKSTSNAEEEEL